MSYLQIIAGQNVLGQNVEVITSVGQNVPDSSESHGYHNVAYTAVSVCVFSAC